MAIIPVYIDREGGKTQTYDVYSRLLKDRTIFIHEEFTEQLASSVVAQLLVLDQDSDKDIQILINSGGGSVVAGLAIYDTMRYLKSKVSTIVMGMSASMGAFTLIGGEIGKRYALPNASIMLHQVSSGTRGTVTDQEISLKHSRDLNERLFTIMAERTGQSFKKLKRLCDRDLWLTPEEALELGVIDKIISRVGDV